MKKNICSLTKKECLRYTPDGCPDDCLLNALKAIRAICGTCKYYDCEYVFGIPCGCGWCTFDNNKPVDIDDICIYHKAK